METPQPFDSYFPKHLQVWIEQRYYARIDAYGRLERLIHDPAFISSPLGHSSLFADHGIVHARDVARQILQVLDRINGVLIPARNHDRLEFMKGIGVQLAYIHDIGLCDLSPFGRKMHAYAVAQKALSPEFDELLEAIWDENAGNVPWKLANMSTLEQDPRLVLREMLALAICHSKSVIPVDLLCDPQQLREAVQRCAVMDLHALYDQILTFRLMKKTSAEKMGATYILGVEGIDVNVSAERMGDLGRYYGDFSSDGLRWLIATSPEGQELVEDVLDTLRALRCSDALRQRGTTLKTSGNYEIFVNRTTGDAIYALRQTDQKLLLLEVPDPISAGEANLGSCELTLEGDLRASFHRGAFETPETVNKVAANAALVLDDIQKDVIESFQRAARPKGQCKDLQKNSAEMQILLEGVDDNPEFAFLVKEHLQGFRPASPNPVRVVPSLKNVSDRERRFYLEGKALDWDADLQQEALHRIAKSGHKTAPIDPSRAFLDVKLIKVPAGSPLIDAGAQPGFVYIPLTGGLRVIPLGGYPTFLIRPWMPFGHTGVIRGAVRNASVIAEDEVTLLMIPQEIYLKCWHHTYDLDEFHQWMESELAREGKVQETLSLMEKALLLKEVVVFSELSDKLLYKIAGICEEVQIKAGLAIFEKGAGGQRLYMILSGRVHLQNGGATLKVLETGALLGDLALLEPQLQMVSAITVENTHLLRMDLDLLGRLLEGPKGQAPGTIPALIRHLREQLSDPNYLQNLRVEQVRSPGNYPSLLPRDETGRGGT